MKNVLLVAVIGIGLMSCNKNNDPIPEIVDNTKIENTEWRAFSSVEAKDTIYTVLEFTDFGTMRSAYRWFNGKLYTGLNEDSYKFNYPDLEVWNQFGRMTGVINVDGQLEFGGVIFRKRIKK